MAASWSWILFLLLTAFASIASAASFTVTNNCGYTVWPATIGGGVELDPGNTWAFDVPDGTSNGHVWGRTGCSFDSGGAGSCETGDCGGALVCTSSWQPPATVADFDIDNNGVDYYDISLTSGFNIAMAFSCSTGGGVVCRDSSCPDGYTGDNDSTAVKVCSGNSNYQITFCPP